ncbi:MAG TPA: NAD/NADP transhydrogenase alpha subunit [Paenibacillaceae bacterium]|nr:NAD/NADP transhydrogenase alpha subunit [Paenibacillaceae bacterium]
MITKCITVYTGDYEVFSDIYEEILALDLAENEEVEIEGITVSDSGEVSIEYIEKMKQKPEVAVMKIRDRNILIMQHGDIFEILIPA